MGNTQRVFDKIKNSNEMPSLPHVLLKLIEACNNSDVTPRELSFIISGDAALSAAVIRLLHSPYSGLNNKVTSIAQAVIFLGIDAIKNIAISASVRQVFGNAEDNGLFKMNQFWLSSITCAIFARKIAKKLDYNSPEEAFLAGILLDIGTLVLWTHFQKSYLKILRQPIPPAQRISLEKELMGANHCEVGAWLIKEWNLSDYISDAVYFHHDDKDNLIHRHPLTRIIYGAHCMADAFLQGKASVDKTLKDIFDFTPAEVNRIIKGTKEEILDVASSIDIQLDFPDDTAHVIEDSEEKQKELAQEVQRISLLNGTLQNLISADNMNTILGIAQQGLQIIFDVSKIVFFLHESGTRDLRAMATDPETAHRFKSVRLCLKKDHSLISRCFDKKATLDSFDILANEPQTSSDGKIIGLLDSEGMLCVPLIAWRKTIGVILIGLSKNSCIHVLNRIKVLTMLANYIAMSLHVDHIKRNQMKVKYDERMATYVQFAQNIVHEVNNPLSIIKNYLKILAMKLPAQSEAINDLKILDEEISRVSHLIVKLHHFSKPSIKHSDPIDVNEILSKLVGIFTKAVLGPARITVRLDADPTAPKIVTDSDLLKQVFINLIKNAAEAMPDGGIIVIRTQNVQSGPDQLNPVTNDIIRGIKIIICDNGPGIPDHIMPRLFEPFNSSKRMGHTGLGLAIVHNIIKELSGTIHCKTTKGTGTSFIIYLPLSCAPL